MSDKPSREYEEMLKRYQKTDTTPIVDKADSLNSASVNQKTKQRIADIKTVLIKDAADIKTVLIKWTIIILIAACVFYFVYPKYTFRFPAGSRQLWKANKITGIVKVYNQDKSRWLAR